MPIQWMRISVVSFLLLWNLGYAHDAMAALSLSLNLSDGSNQLRLENIAAGLNNKKELRVRITSTSGQRYQVFQRVQEPLMNEQGQSLDVQAIETATTPNSNASGTLYLQNMDRLAFSDQLLYTSGQGGEADAFEIGYALNPDMVGSGGRYSGKLVFLVREMGGATQEQVVLPLFVETASTRAVEVKGTRHPGLIRVRDADTEKTVDSVNISFSGFSGEDVRIYQEVESFPLDPVTGEAMTQGIQFYTVGESQYIKARTPAELERGAALIYSGRKNEDQFFVYFLMDPAKLDEQDAGTYAGRIKYTIETSAGREQYFIDLECHIQPVFALEVDVPPQGIAFNGILPKTPPVEREVLVKVKSNLHRPYQVMQDMTAPMTNEKGEQINKQFFTQKIDVPAGQKGQARFVDFTPVDSGEYPVFVSDGVGTPAEFRVIYRLEGYPEIKSGDFSAPVRFSLNQN